MEACWKRPTFYEGLCLESLTCVSHGFINAVALFILAMIYVVIMTFTVSMI